MTPVHYRAAARPSRIFVRASEGDVLDHPRCWASCAMAACGITRRPNDRRCPICRRSASRDCPARRTAVVRPGGGDAAGGDRPAGDGRQTAQTRRTRKRSSRPPAMRRPARRAVGAFYKRGREAGEGGRPSARSATPHSSRMILGNGARSRRCPRQITQARARRGGFRRVARLAVGVSLGLPWRNRRQISKPASGALSNSH